MDSAAPNILRATAFLDALKLPEPRRNIQRATGGLGSKILPVNEKQSLIVGSNIVSFLSGLPSKERELVVNCSLLAQLAANKKVSSRNDIQGWYEAFFDTLANIGWVVQERGFSKYYEAGDVFETNRAVLSVARDLLGQGTTAYMAVKAALNGLEELNDDRWLTVFRSESQVGNAARFQMLVAEPEQEGGVTLSLMSFVLEAKRSFDQVLFLKFDYTEATLSHASGRVAMDNTLMHALASKITKKLKAYIADYVVNLSI